MIGNIWMTNPTKNKGRLKYVGFNLFYGKHLYTFENKLPNLNYAYELFGEDIIVLNFEEYNNEIKL